MSALKRDWTKMQVTEVEFLNGTADCKYSPLEPATETFQEYMRENFKKQFYDQIAVVRWETNGTYYYRFKNGDGSFFYYEMQRMELRYTEIRFGNVSFIWTVTEDSFVEMQFKAEDFIIEECPGPQQIK